MPQVTFIKFDGSRKSVDAVDGDSLLRVAQAFNIEGITGECGGCLSCATCHVYVDAPWQDKLTPPSADEDVMLDGTYCDREPGSRLGCQIHVTAALDGITVRLPERQT